MWPLMLTWCARCVMAASKEEVLTAVLPYVTAGVNDIIAEYAGSRADARLLPSCWNILFLLLDSVACAFIAVTNFVSFSSVPHSLSSPLPDPVCLLALSVAVTEPLRPRLQSRTSWIPLLQPAPSP